MSHVHAILMAGAAVVAILFPLDRLIPDSRVPIGGIIGVAVAGAPDPKADIGPVSAAHGTRAADAARRAAGTTRRDPAAGGTTRPVVTARALQTPTLFEYLRSIVRD